MSKIKNSPLIEAMFELRWGDKGDGAFEFNRDESEFLPGIFSHAIKKIGYDFTERPNSNSPPIPFLPTYRFRKAANKWPCFQLGLGFFAINQIGASAVGADDNDEYDWDDFRPAIKNGLDVFSQSYPSGLENLLSPVATLRYQDGFILERNESLEQFISNKIKADIHLTEIFQQQKDICTNSSEVKMEFAYNTIKPEGKISLSLISAQIKGKPGIVIETRVTSKIKRKDSSVQALLKWADDAKILQNYSFETLILAPKK